MARRNKKAGWPFYDHARHFYRPPFAEQVEWTSGSPESDSGGLPSLPESRALMKLIDSCKPELMVSMHNAELDGVHCYLTSDAVEVADAMVELRTLTGLPPYLGEPEHAAESKGPGVFVVAPTPPGAEMVGSTDYASRHGAFGIVTEPPMWLDPRAGDERPTGSRRAEAYERFARDWTELATEHGDWMDAIDGRLTLRTPLHRSVLDDATVFANVFPEVRLDAADEPSTIASESFLASRLRTSRLRWGAEADHAAARFVGLTGAVQVQVGLALAGAEHDR